MPQLKEPAEQNETGCRVRNGSWLRKNAASLNNEPAPLEVIEAFADEKAGVLDSSFDACATRAS
jgi:hypothetical protein